MNEWPDVTQPSSFAFRSMVEGEGQRARGKGHKLLPTCTKWVYVSDSEICKLQSICLAFRDM